MVGRRDRDPDPSDGESIADAVAVGSHAQFLDQLVDVAGRVEPLGDSIQGRTCRHTEVVILSA
jgi:hypothetical protein